MHLTNAEVMDKMPNQPALLASVGKHPGRACH